jgi:hypothetical protein
MADPESEAPPGRVVRFFDDDPAQMARILSAVAGLRARLEALREVSRAGSSAYHGLSREIGFLCVIEAQCIRAIDVAAVRPVMKSLADAEAVAERVARREGRRV